MIAAVVAGMLLVVGVTAGAVVALGSSSPGPTAAAAPRASVSTGPATAEPSAEAPTTAAPTPSSTVTGAVKSGGTHTGDLRYFLLTPPEDAEIYGDEDGSELTRSQIADGSASVRSALATYGFKSGATRTYLTADGDTQVVADLVRFSAPAGATAFYSRFYFSGTGVTIGGSHPAKAYRHAKTVIVVSHQGDVHITLTVTGARVPGSAQLRRLVDRQYDRLETGR